MGPACSAGAMGWGGEGRWLGGSGVGGKAGAGRPRGVSLEVPAAWGFLAPRRPGQSMATTSGSMPTTSGSMIATTWARGCSRRSLASLSFAYCTARSRLVRTNTWTPPSTSELRSAGSFWYSDSWVRSLRASRAGGVGSTRRPLSSWHTATFTMSIIPRIRVACQCIFLRFPCRGMALRRRVGGRPARPRNSGPALVVGVAPRPPRPARNQCRLGRPAADARKKDNARGKGTRPPFPLALC